LPFRLPRKHLFRSDRKNFIKNTVVTKGPPKRLNATEIYAQLNNLVLNEKGGQVLRIQSVPQLDTYMWSVGAPLYVVIDSYAQH
jgi:hypothetical protein